MVLQFVYGLAGAGKTQHCIQAIVAALTDEAPTGRLLLLVPEQASLQTERRLAAAMPTRGFAGAEVLSFTRLAQQVLSNNVLQPQVLTRTARVLALQTLALERQSNWRHLRDAAQWPGFFEQLDRMIESLLLEGVMPDQLAAAAETLGAGATQDKARDIADIYAAYLEWLGSERLDPAMRQQQLVHTLEQAAWLRAARIWIDGFAFFDAQTQKTIVTLASHAPQVTLTLLCDPDGLSDETPPEGELFRRTLLTRQQLRSELEAAGVKQGEDIRLKPDVLHRYAQAPGLAQIEHAWRTQQPCVSANRCADLQLFAAESSREELRRVARHIRSAVSQSSGALRFSDFAVIARDLNALAAQIQEVFADFDVPCFLDQRRPLNGHPLARLVLELVDTAAKPKLIPSEIIGLLNSPLLPIERATREQLAREGTLGSDGEWDAPLSPFDRTLRRPRTSAEVRQAWRLLRAALEPLAAFAVRDDVTAERWALALKDVLSELRVDRTLQAWIETASSAGRWEASASHHGAWTAIMDLLAELHMVIGERVMSLSALRQVLRIAIAERSFAIAPPMLDQVLIAAIDRSRHPEVRHVWVVGMNEGIFPAPPPDDTLLSTLERITLSEQGLRAPQPGTQKALDERLLAYIAFTRPSETLTISYAHQGADGSSLEPSPYVEQLQTLLPGLEAQPLSERPLPVTLHDAARAAQRWDAFGAALDERLRSAVEFAEPYTYFARGQRYTNLTQRVTPFRQPPGELAAAGVVWHTSVTEVQRYLNCPFQHFAADGLRLVVATQPTFLEARAVGELTHRILAEVINAVRDPEQPIASVDDEQWQATLKAACEQHLGASDAPWRLRQPQQAFYADVLAQRLAEVVLAQAARYRRGSFEPLGCEIDFGSVGGEWPALSVGLANQQRITLHGRIDRLDVCPSDGEPGFMVCDYKARPLILKPDPLLHEALQLVLYAQAVLARHAEWRWLGGQIIPYKPDTKVLSNKYVEEASRAVQTYFLFRPRGWILKSRVDAVDAQLSDQTSYVMQLKRNKDGSVSKVGDAYEQDLFDATAQRATESVKLAAAGVLAGDVTVRPLVVKRTLACTRCDYQRVCRFNRPLNPPQAAETLLKSSEADTCS